MTLASGETYSELEKLTGPFRQSYAKRNGWEYLVPELDCSPSKVSGDGKQRYIDKLFLPQLYLDYDLIAFMDCDSLVNPKAPCLSEYYHLIPKGGFAAGQTISFDERKHFAGWAEDYYKPYEKHCIEQPIKDRKTHINAGLLLFRPAEVAERWQALAAIDLPITSENRLNIYELQNGKCHLLPREWHILWQYYRDINYPILGRLAKVGRGVDKLFGYKLNFAIEREKFIEAFSRANFIHVAFEHQKLHWFLKGLSPRDFE